MERVITQRQDLDGLMRLLQARKLPCTVTVKEGKPRTSAQNRLQRQWHNEAAEQLGDEPAEDKRAYCKLVLGVPILRAADDDFRESYDRVIKPLPYEHKLEAMKEPLDFPVSRLMTTKQKSEFLDAIYQHYRGQGVALTEPEAFGL